MRADVTWSYARELLERWTGERPCPDEDGDLPVVLDGACVYVRVVSPHDAVVEVFAVAAHGLPASARVLAEVNRLNGEVRFGRWWHSGDRVLLGLEVWGDDLTPGNLRHACSHVAELAQQGGFDLARRFGGVVPGADGPAPGVPTPRAVRPPEPSPYL